MMSSLTKKTLTHYYMEKNNLRYERKFFITDFTREETESLIMLHPAAFSEIYHERIVNNIYLDSLDMSSYFDNVIGLEKRVKVRIRWYGDLLGAVRNPALEVKTKNGLVCNKESFPLAGFVLDAGFSRSAIQDIIRMSEIPDRLKLDLNCMDISLLNSYRRKYYLSADKKYRITLDSNLEFYGIAPLENRFLDRSIDHRAVVLEVKYGEDSDAGAHAITNYFPFRMTKSSKYIMGIERLNLMKTYSHV